MRLASFNILHGRSPATGEVDPACFRDAVRELDADVLALQEVDRDQPRSHLADFTALAAEAGGYPEHRFVAAVAGTPGATWMAATGDEQPGSAAYGIALLSRFPARTWQVVRLPAIRYRFPMWLPGPRRMMIVREEPRVAVVAELETPDGRLVVGNTHLSFVPGWNRRQLRLLARDLTAFDGPLAFTGDLNLTPPTPARLTGWRPAVSAATFPVEEPTRQLDHVLLRGPVAAGEGRSHRLPLSDHRAISVELRVERPGIPSTATR